MALPPTFRIALDPGVRRLDGGAVLVGGSPLRILRLRAAGARAVDELGAGAPVGSGSGRQKLARRLLDAGMAHPRPELRSSPTDAVTVVIPVLDRDPSPTLGSLGAAGTVIVVDDGSMRPVAGLEGTRLITHDRPRGPAAARNSGWRAAVTELVAFVDADCIPPPGWLGALLPHFQDHDVAAVAPRILARPASGAPSWLAAYESVRSPLDQGPNEATVRPRSPVGYVPTATLVVRRSALEKLGGFDESLRFGEDVDLVWRLVAAGWTVRYDPAVTVTHPTRSTGVEWVRQRYDYGTSAAPLARRHGRAVAPLTVSSWSALAWGLAGVSHPVAGTAVAVGTTALLAPRLGSLQHPWQEAVRLAGRGNVYAGLSVAGAIRRAWWPVALPLVLSRRARVGVVTAFVGPPVAEWVRSRPGIDPVRWALLRLLDDMAYGAGVWAGCVRERSAAALVPDLATWPGRRAAVES